MAIELRIRVQPRASRNEIVGWREADDDALPVLAIRLTAPPVDGAANRACRDFLAQALGLKRAQVTLVAGEKSREKRFRLDEISTEAVRERVAAATGPTPSDSKSAPSGS